MGGHYDNYDSRDGMMTSVWGPSTWHMLHRDFVLGLVHVLPCGKCRENLARTLATLPLRAAHMQSRASFSRYMYDLHETVNDMLGKRSGLSYEQVRDRYEHFRARCGAPPPPQTPTKKKNRSVRARDAHHRGEKGCTEPSRGRKTKCVLRILPLGDKRAHDFRLCS